VRAIVAGGASLKRHWNAGLARTALAERWDHVVLQEQSTLPVKNAQRYHDNVRLFARDMAESGARIALYLTWSRRSEPETQDAIAHAVNAIASEVGARVVPVGPAWQEALREVPGLQLYEEDGSHPTRAGSYLAACTFHVALFDRPVRGDAVAAALRIQADVARRLEAIAWAQRAPRDENVAARRSATGNAERDALSEE
jgi:hypothetical protein